MARFNSLLGRNKFPVPMRRELRRKPLNLMLDCEPISALGGPDEQNSAEIPSLQGISSIRGFAARQWQQKRALNQRVMSQLPTHPNRDFFAALQGI
jgi:hypothetical protein